MKDKKSSRGIILVVIAGAIALLVGAVTGPAILLQTAIAAQDEVNMAHRSTGITSEGNVPTAITEGSFETISDIGMATTTATTTTSADNTQHRVAVGGGNLTVSINQFSPSTVEINTGESVTFYAPNGSTELHNVVLDLSNGTAISSVELAFILPPGFSSGTLQLAPPDNFGEPIIQNLSGGRQSIIALNKVLFHPSAVSQDGHASYLQERELIQLMEQGEQQGLFMPSSLSANYTIQGTEVVVSSGLILDVTGFAALEQEQGAQQK